MDNPGATLTTRRQFVGCFARHMVLSMADVAPLVLYALAQGCQNCKVSAALRTEAE